MIGLNNWTFNAVMRVITYNNVFSCTYPKILRFYQQGLYFRPSSRVVDCNTYAKYKQQRTPGRLPPGQRQL